MWGWFRRRLDEFVGFSERPIKIRRRRVTVIVNTAAQEVRVVKRRRVGLVDEYVLLIGIGVITGAWMLLLLMF